MHALPAKTLPIALALACLLGGGAHAADWPGGVVKTIVPFPPGGTTDQVARMVADDLSKSLGRQFIIENRPGANTQIGTDAVAKAKPDGSTFLLTTAPYAIIAALYPTLPYDPLKDLEPVIRVAENAMLLVASPAAPAKTIKDMLDVSRAKPGSLLLATVGTTGVSAMSNELFAALGKVQITSVPYKGTGQVMPDLLGGQVHYLFDNPSSSMPNVRAGKLHAVAYTGKKRSPALPHVPTVAESGLPGYETVNWYGIFAPAKTSPEILDRLNQEVNRIIKRPEVTQRLAQDAVETVGGTRAEFASVVKAEIGKWSKLAKERNIKPE
jgi:tripartite-type tricarboxylate transporter receptor subunit TctC